MIGKLSGRVDSIENGQVLLDVSGVGYLVQCSPRTLSALEPETAASLLIEMHVREDGMFLYGFSDSGERQWFRLLTSVQGVGARTALALLGVCPPERLGPAIAAGDKTSLLQAEGVGPKLAARILTELKDKASRMATEALRSPDAPLKGHNASNTAQNHFPAPHAIQDTENDAISVLINLGYARTQAAMAVSAARIAANGDEKLDTLIRLALRQMNR